MHNGACLMMGSSGACEWKTTVTYLRQIFIYFCPLIFLSQLLVIEEKKKGIDYEHSCIKFGRQNTDNEKVCWTKEFLDNFFHVIALRKIMRGSAINYLPKWNKSWISIFLDKGRQIGKRFEILFQTLIQRPSYSKITRKKFKALKGA